MLTDKIFDVEVADQLLILVPLQNISSLADENLQPELKEVFQFDTGGDDPFGVQFDGLALGVGQTPCRDQAYVGVKCGVEGSHAPAKVPENFLVGLFLRRRRQSEPLAANRHQIYGGGRRPAAGQTR